MVWAVVMGGLGYVFGASLEALIGQIKHYEKIIVALIIIGGLAFWVIRKIRGNKGAEEINPEDKES
jgi:membrane protein DedA with SNARE-associated domain